MSVEYRYDEENNIIYTRLFGVVTDKDLKDQGEALAEDTRVKPGLRELVDLSGIEEIQGSSESLERNIQIDTANSEKLAGMRSAIVADTDLTYGFARMYQTLAELRDSPLTVEVFRTIEEARKWLGLDED